MFALCTSINFHSILIQSLLGLCNIINYSHTALTKKVTISGNGWWDLNSISNVCLILSPAQHHKYKYFGNLIAVGIMCSSEELHLHLIFLQSLYAILISDSCKRFSWYKTKDANMDNLHKYCKCFFSPKHLLILESWNLELLHSTK